MTAAWCALVVIVCAGCATSVTTLTDELGTTPTVWQGVITGRELATAAGVTSMKATLTLAPDGTWTSVCDNGRASGRVISTYGRAWELEGALESGAPIRYRLYRAHPGHAAGGAHTYFIGHSVDTGIDLGRVK